MGESEVQAIRNWKDFAPGDSQCFVEPGLAEIVTGLGCAFL